MLSFAIRSFAIRSFAIRSFAIRVLFLVPLAIGLTTVVFAEPSAASTSPDPSDPGGRYVMPIKAPIVDRFRAPAHNYAPGNRGVEFTTTPGTEVVAANSGRVSFAGKVASITYVVIEHPDGLRTTYGGLSGLQVIRGQEVSTGEQVGVSARSFHFGVRREDTYLDPLALMGSRPHLVPLGLEASNSAVEPVSQPVPEAHLKKPTLSSQTENRLQSTPVQAVPEQTAGVQVAGVMSTGMIAAAGLVAWAAARPRGSRAGSSG